MHLYSKLLINFKKKVDRQKVVDFFFFFDKKNLVEIAKISGIFVFLVIFKPAIFIATKLLKESFAAIFLTT